MPSLPRRFFSSVGVRQNERRVETTHRELRGLQKPKGLSSQGLGASDTNWREVKPMTDDELERRYRELLRNPAIRQADEASMSNKAMPVDENALLEFVRRTGRSHATFVHGVFENHGLN